jgi:hypothetical protein
MGIAADSGWHRLSSIKEEYLRLVEFAEVHSIKNLTSWEEFRDSMIKVVGNDVPVDYSEYNVRVSPDGKIIEEYNGEVHITNPQKQND